MWRSDNVTVGTFRPRHPTAGKFICGFRCSFSRPRASSLPFPTWSISLRAPWLPLPLHDGAEPGHCPAGPRGFALPDTSEQHSGLPALACAWRPPQTRRQRASRDPAKGRTRSDARPPPAFPSPHVWVLAPRVWQDRGPGARADDAQAPGDHFRKEPAIP